MKKNFLLKLAALSAALGLTVGMTAGCSSNTGSTADRGTPPTPPDGDFVNPGDNLGGGGTATKPEEVSYSEEEQAIITAANGGLDNIVTATEDTTSTALASDGVISAAGSYILSGDYPSGITFGSGISKGDTVKLYLDGANISSETGSAIVKSDKQINLYIIANAGTQNTISTSVEGANALQVKGTLYICGSGKLTVHAGGDDANGIKVSKGLYVTETDLKVSASKNAVSAETIVAANTSITVSAAGKDGLHAECDFDNKKGMTYDFTLESGFVALKNVTYTCTVKGDGIQADTFVFVDGGNNYITTEGEFVSYSAANMSEYGLTSDDFRYVRSGSKYKKTASDENGNFSSKYALVQSCKGIKVGEIDYDTDGDDEDDVTITENTNYAIVLQSGTYNIDSTDDSIHANGGNTYINGGEYVINTYDDGITSDVLTEIKAGTIDIQSSYEGIEGGYVKISGGTINIVSSDDGINAASDDTSVKEYIIISGGDIAVNAEGDGLDSNGSILISGGKTVVHGPTSGGDGSLDSETGILVNGGTLYAGGSLGMVETPGQNSSQCVLSYAQNSSVAAGSVVTLATSDGTTILEVTTEKVSRSIIISAPELVNGGSYVLSINGSSVATFTVSGTITSVGSTGGMGGGGQPGGNRPGGGFGGR